MTVEIGAFCATGKALLFDVYDLATAIFAESRAVVASATAAPSRGAPPPQPASSMTTARFRLFIFSSSIRSLRHPRQVPAPGRLPGFQYYRRCCCDAGDYGKQICEGLLP